MEHLYLRGCQRKIKRMQRLRDGVEFHIAATTADCGHAHCLRDGGSRVIITGETHYYCIDCRDVFFRKASIGRYTSMCYFRLTHVQHGKFFVHQCYELVNINIRVN